MSRREASGNRTFWNAGPRVLKRLQKRTHELNGGGITVHAGNLHCGREHPEQVSEGSVKRGGVGGAQHGCELGPQRLQ